ncbi:MAG TPA: type II secretion system F family protein [Burkholderiales bacterium]|nr:type II secretion system F family protein [Burkholderiales bacterium]
MHYQVRGLGNDGAILVLEVDARDERDANEQAASRGLAVLSVRRRAGVGAWIIARRTRFPLLLFSQELLALLQSGISLVESIETLAEKEQRPETRKVLDQLIARLRQGQALSASLQQSPSVFPALYVAAVRAAERTGDLEEALSRFIAYQSQIDAVRKKLISSAIYPAMLIGVGLLVTLFLLGYVVPRFSQVYEDMGDRLPWMSRVLMHWGKLIEQHAMGMAIAVVAAAALAVHWLARPETLQRIASWLWRIPALGQRMRIYQLARFYRTLGMLLRGGIAVVPALDMVSGLLQSSLRTQLDQASRLMREGKPISQGMETAGLATPIALRMLRVGERSGRMGEMMERIAAFHDEEMARWVDWFTRVFEPLLMAFIGIVIGLIVVLLYLPIFELAGSIQ